MKYRVILAKYYENILKFVKVMHNKPSVWFTLTETETEIPVNGKILIPLTETKMETQKLQKTETKRKWKNLKRKLINLAMSIFVSVVFPFHAITQVLCNVIR